VERLATTLNDQRRQVAMDAIARAAVAQFTRRGFATTSVEDIAGAAGCSARTFYRYFSAKEDVLFHDLPAMMDRLRAMLQDFLDAGLAPWDATAETLISLINRFDDVDEATDRIGLWISEPALRARYIQYVTQAEGVIAQTLRVHAGSSMSEATAWLIAVVAVGTYRVTLFTAQPSSRDPLGERLREALRTAGAGLG
jgi:AcrR family transcriptional regulator